MKIVGGPQVWDLKIYDDSGNEMKNVIDIKIKPISGNRNHEYIKAVITVRNIY